jgi:RNA polymerase sigma-70 factor (ECF subfamily)
MAFLVTGSAAAAQDLVQDSFIELIRWRPGHRKGSFKAYLSTAVYRRALKEKKRSGLMSSLDRVDLEDSAVSPLEGVVKEERDRAIAGAIRSLDRDHRDILVLRFYGGHSYRAIAEMTGLPLGTVKSRIFYAVKICRKRLKEKGWIE